MRLDQSSMDISTLVEKIRNDELDLQPSFQRGQVWSDSKKKRLVDTILRQWYVPAIHIIVNDDLDSEEVLDGQQRLRSILEFMEDEFPIDGNIAPYDAEIHGLDGSFYSDLPDRVRSKFKRFAITTVRLRDYRPEEPGELFFRLNQLTALTAAEQRNALVGEPRNQIRQLSKVLEGRLSGRGIGFSNARMNYDDTLARLALTLDGRGLGEKITAGRLEKRYREGHGFSIMAMDRISNSIESISEIISTTSAVVKLNRASLFSWLYFLSDRDVRPSRVGQIANFFFAFESMRSVHVYATMLVSRMDRDMLVAMNESPAARKCIGVFNDRASSRVNDVSSVLLRDACLNVCAHEAFSAVSGVVLHRPEIWIDDVVRDFAALPDDVADRALVEGWLAKSWEARVAPR